jgi:hypothetical protein
MVLAYLLFNIAGRLSVALFGLTFDINEVDGIEFPVMVTDWSKVDWTEFDFEVDPQTGQLKNLTSVGK